MKEARITHGSMRDWFQSENEVRSRENGVSETFETRDKTRAQHDAGDTIAREAPCFIYRDLAADWSCAGVVASREAPKGLPLGVGNSTKDGSVHSITQLCTFCTL